MSTSHPSRLAPGSIRSGVGVVAAAQRERFLDKHCNMSLAAFQYRVAQRFGLSLVVVPERGAATTSASATGLATAEASVVVTSLVHDDQREVSDGLDDVGRYAAALVFPPPWKAQRGMAPTPLDQQGDLGGRVAYASSTRRLDRLARPESVSLNGPSERDSREHRSTTPVSCSCGLDAAELLREETR